MVLRRLREHVSHHNWFAVAIDFVIVVLGVFVGIQASNWNQARVARDQAREYRSMLSDDLNTNIANFATREGYYRWVRSEGLATLAALNRPSGSLDEHFLIDAYQASQMMPWGLKRNTYDEILSVGAISNLGDPLLRDQVSNYYVGAEVTRENMTALPPYREILRRIMPYAVQQRIRARCNETITQDSRGGMQITLPGACTLGLDPATVRVAIAQVHDWPGLGLDLNRWIVDLDQKLLSADTLSRRAIKLKGALQQVDR